MAIPQGMAVQHLIVKMGASTEIVVFCRSVHTKNVHLMGTVTLQLLSLWLGMLTTNPDFDL